MEPSPFHLVLVLFQSFLVKPSPSLPLVDELSINWLVVSIPMGNTDERSTELATLASLVGRAGDLPGWGCVWTMEEWGREGDRLSMSFWRCGWVGWRCRTLKGRVGRLAMSLYTEGAGGSAGDVVVH